jgi:hypothetical protein
VPTQYIPQQLICPSAPQQIAYNTGNNAASSASARSLVFIIGSSVPMSVKSYIVQRLHNELPGLFSEVTTAATASTVIANASRSKRALVIPPVVRTCAAIQTAVSGGSLGVIIDGVHMPVGLSATARAEFCAAIQGLPRCTIPKPALLLLTAPAYASGSSTRGSCGSSVDSKLQYALHTAYGVVALAKTAAAQASFTSLSLLTQAPSAAHILALQAVMILTSPLGTVFPVPQANVNQGGVAWSSARRLLLSSSSLCDRMAAVDTDAILPVNIIALNGYVTHTEWPKSVWCGMNDDTALSVMITWVTAITDYATLLQVSFTVCIPYKYITDYKAMTHLFECN